jgi:hypothetical protein
LSRPLFIDIVFDTEAILKVFEGENILGIASGNVKASGTGTRGNDKSVVRKPLSLGVSQIHYLDPFPLRINFCDAVFCLHINILHLFKLLRGSNHQFFLIFYYIADVVGGFS